MKGMAPLVLFDKYRPDHTLSLDEYRQMGGYKGLSAALREYSPAGIKQMVNDSGLQGRGGAGFPTARKWMFLKDDAPFPRYFVCNTDEMEPGTFKDRTLIHTNPHAVIEGMIIAAYAVSAGKGFFFVRPSYEQVTAVFARALDTARKAGFLGRNILGSGHSFDILVHRSGGRYICGEAKAQVHALEGKRPNPNIEGHLTSRGLWGQPTVINNAETLAYIPSIVRKGAQWFRELARNQQSSGLKIFCVSGRVYRPGAYELPMGIPLREIIEVHAGGMRAGYEFKTCLPGGASTRFIPKKFYEIPMDFASLKKLGSGHRLGTGAVVVFDHKTCLVDAVLNLIHFFARESCGWCTPCREGLPYVEDLLWRIENGEGREEFIPLLQEMSGHMDKAYCDFALGAVTPVRGLIEDFLDEVHEHISQKQCPFRGSAKEPEGTHPGREKS